MYAQHMNLQDRRDQNLDSNGSTPFQAHQSLGHALGNHTHLTATYARAQDPYRHPSTSPPTLNQPGSSAQNHGGPSGVHQPLAFAQVNGQTSPALKRKQMDANQINVHINKRRREEDDSFDMGEGGQGAKHWTDEEKTRLFTWLMGASNNEHWASLRATKNSCLRECANDVFEGKKTYQALKGCYERNFNVFKQIYACESFNGHRGKSQSPNEAERLREYERRLQSARKANVDIGNITARNLEHWHSRGWYQLFFDRWHGDPATTKPVVARAPTSTNTHNGGPEDGDDDEPPIPQPPNSSSAMEFPQPDPTLLTNGLTNGLSHDRPPQPTQHPHHVYINTQTLTNASSNRPEVRHIHPPPPPQQHTPQQQHAHPHSHTQHQQPQQPSHSQLPQPPQGNGTTVPNAMVSSPSTLHPPAPHPQTMAGNSPHPPQPQTHRHSSHHPVSAANLASGPNNAVNGNTSTPSGSGGGDISAVPMSFTPQMLTAFMQYCQAQTHASKMKMEYLRRREEREEKEHRAKLEGEQLRLERDRYELEQLKSMSMSKLKTERAFDLVSRNDIDPAVKRAASDYVRKILQEES